MLENAFFLFTLMLARASKWLFCDSSTVPTESQSLRALMQWRWINTSMSTFYGSAHGPCKSEVWWINVNLYVWECVRKCSCRNLLSAATSCDMLGRGVMTLFCPFCSRPIVKSCCMPIAASLLRSIVLYYEEPDSRFFILQSMSSSGEL